MPDNDDDKPAPPPSPRSFIDDLRAGKYPRITEAPPETYGRGFVIGAAMPPKRAPPKKP